MADGDTGMVEYVFAVSLPAFPNPPLEWLPTVDGYALTDPVTQDVIANETNSDA